MWARTFVGVRQMMGAALSTGAASSSAPAPGSASTPASNASSSSSANTSNRGIFGQSERPVIATSVDLNACAPDSLVAKCVVDGADFVEVAPKTKGHLSGAYVVRTQRRPGS